MKLFLDDIREPWECVYYMQHRIGKDNPIYLKNWFVVRNYDEFIEAVQKNHDKITHISFDHDLAHEHYDVATWEGEHKYDEKTGYECAKWLKEFYESKGIPLPIMYVHSMNPVGTQRIIDLFKS